MIKINPLTTPLIAVKLNLIISNVVSNVIYICSVFVLQIASLAELLDYYI